MVPHSVQKAVPGTFCFPHFGHRYPAPIVFSGRGAPHFGQNLCSAVTVSPHAGHSFMFMATDPANPSMAEAQLPSAAPRSAAPDPWDAGAVYPAEDASRDRSFVAAFSASLLSARVCAVWFRFSAACPASLSAAGLTALSTAFPTAFCRPFPMPLEIPFPIPSLTASPSAPVSFLKSAMVSPFWCCAFCALALQFPGPGAWFHYRFGLAPVSRNKLYTQLSLLSERGIELSEQIWYHNSK